MNNLFRKAIYGIWSLSGFLATYLLYFPGACSGYAGIYAFISAAGIFSILTVFLLITGWIGLRNPEFKISFFPWGTIILLVFFYWFIPYRNSEMRKGKKMLEAVTSSCGCGDSSSLTLRDHNRYEIKLSQTEFICRYFGSYTIRRDSLYLEGPVMTETDTAYFPVYVIDWKDSLMVPVYQGKAIQERNRFLTLSRVSQDWINPRGMTAR